MKRLITTVRNLILGGAVLLSSLAQAQFTSFTPTGSYKFPQQPSYVAGRTPASISVADAQKAYEDWKRDFVTSSGACGERRVIWDYFSGGRGKTDKSSTVSEGVAYGMLLAAYAADKDLFDDLWDYYKKHRNGNGVMNWQVENCSVKGQNGASDAELDVAMALIVASHQWQSDAYLSDAKNMIRVVREKEFQNDVLKPGDAFGGSALTNPSYFSPAYYRVFAQLEPSQATFWNNAITKGYQIIAAADKSNNGLVPDWCDAAGNKVNGKTIDGININSTYEDGGQNFIYDAIRTPFRSAVDYLWHGSKANAGRDYCNKLVDWAITNHSGTTYQLGSKYSTSGAKLSGDHSNTFVSCFSIAAMAADGGTQSSKYQSFLNSGYADNKSTQPGYGQYFNSTFKVLGFFVMSGHFYLPPPDACISPELGSDKSLCKSVTLDALVTGRNYQWKKDGVIQIGKTSQTLAVTTSGFYEVIATDAQGCTRRDAVNVFDGPLSADFVAVPSAGGFTINNTSTGGVSNYTWTVKKGTTNSATSTDASPVFTGLTAGIYDVTLVINNSGFGCTGTSTKTKKVTVGQGAGIAMDDFNGLYEKGVNLYTYGPGANFDPFPVTFCSKADETAGNAKECQNHRCSYVDLVCKGSLQNWATMEYEFLAGSGAPFDLSNGAFVSIKMKASAPVTIDVRLGTPDGTKTFLSTPFKAALTTTEQVFTFDFTSVLTGDVDGTAKTIAAWNKVTKLAIRPYTTTLGYTGTISIDYVIVGAKALSPPTFDIRKDADGYTDFNNYLPDYFPNDPKYASCTTADKTGLCYGAVQDWEREVLACTGNAVITANACLASEVRWYNGATLVATGDQATLPAGKYYVDLIGAGGITRDSVVVKTVSVSADFTIDRDNLTAKFNNNSRDYDTFTWNYGDVANDEPGSTTWDIGFHNYATAVGTAASKTFPVKLTVTNTECGISKVITKQVIFSCDSPAEFEYTVSKTTGLCEGEVITAEITSSAHAVWFGFFPPSDATTVLSTDKKKATITLGASSGDLSIQADNGCSAVNVEEVVALANTAKPLATFTALEEPNRKVSFNASEVGATSYTWAFGDATSGTGKTVAHTYATAKVYNACLTVVNACGTKQTCKDVSATITGLAGQDAAGNISVYPTAVSSEIGVILPGKAKVSVIDVLGNTLREENMNDKGSINVSELKAGMYLLNIEQNGEVITKRFVKE